jgi:membrane-bound ClpP family serine protease
MSEPRPRIVVMPAKRWWRTKEHLMSIGTILLIILVLMLVGVLPVWPHASSWGYGPSGIVGAILIIIVVLLLLGRI